MAERFVFKITFEVINLASTNYSDSGGSALGVYFITKKTLTNSKEVQNRTTFQRDCINPQEMLFDHQKPCNSFIGRCWNTQNALARGKVLPFCKIDLSSPYFFFFLIELDESKHRTFLSNKQKILLKIAVSMAQLIFGFDNFPSDQGNMRVEVYSNRAISVSSLAPDQSNTQITEALFQLQSLIYQR